MNKIFIEQKLQVPQYFFEVYKRKEQQQYDRFCTPQIFSFNSTKSVPARAKSTVPRQSKLEFTYAPSRKDREIVKTSKHNGIIIKSKCYFGH